MFFPENFLFNLPILVLTFPGPPRMRNTLTFDRRESGYNRARGRNPRVPRPLRYIYNLVDF